MAAVGSWTAYSADGSARHRRRVRPEREGGGKGTFVFVHGLGEHCGRYDELLARMAAEGLDAFAGDLEGHGKSDGRRAYVEKFGNWVDDAVAIVDDALERTSAPPGAPLFIQGQSMGGLIAVHVVLRDQSKFRNGGLILTSAALDVEWTLTLKMQAPLGALLSWLVPTWRIVPAVRPEDMSKDPLSVADYTNDPLNTIGNTSARTGNEVLQAFRGLVPQYSAVTVPVLALHGTHDHCTSLSAVERFVEACGSRDKEMKKMEGLYHTMLHEPERASVLDAIAAWTTRRTIASAKL